MSEKHYDGPLSVAPGQLGDADALATSIFTSHPEPRTMAERFPMLYGLDHLDSLRVFTCEGQPVSLLGLAVCDAVTLGCTTRIGCIGSVCTDESARGCGLAGRLVDDAKTRAADQGASVILISGHRKLYVRRGAVAAGVSHRYTFTVDSLGDDTSEVTADELAENEAQIALEMYKSEPVRFVNSEKDYLVMIASGQTMARPGKTYVIRRAGQIVAIVSVNYYNASDERRYLGVREMTGCRRSMISALPQILADSAPDAQEVIIDAYAADEQMRDACAAIGARPLEESHLGTVMLLNPQRLLMDFLPLLTDRIGPEAAADLNVQPHADEMKINTLTFRLGADKLTIDGTEALTAALFGKPGSDPLAQFTGPLVQTLRRALPLPLPLYGLRYV